jgi:hypothetical protein
MYQTPKIIRNMNMSNFSVVRKPFPIMYERTYATVIETSTNPEPGYVKTIAQNITAEAKRCLHSRCRLFDTVEMR